MSTLTCERCNAEYEKPTGNKMHRLVIDGYRLAWICDDCLENLEDAWMNYYNTLE